MGSLGQVEPKNDAELAHKFSVYEYFGSNTPWANVILASRLETHKKRDAGISLDYVHYIYLHIVYSLYRLYVKYIYVRKGLK